ncbi:MAG TPA: thioredoxin family protein [Methylomirabilota bacterium]|jgi:peroxiredoxin|nr:thioredoxin family protein [Methylomirabilota bacterium]
MPVSAPVCEFGWKAEEFDLEGVDGRRVRLADLRGPRGTLVMFICNHCPYVKAVIDRLVRDCAELQALGVSTLAIMPNDTEAYPEDSFENMKAFAARHRFPFPYAIDRTQEVARAYGAACTPDFFGFNAALELQYRGRIDDAGPRGTEVKRRELFEAMKQVAETGRGPADQIPSMGCSIKWRTG